METSIWKEYDRALDVARRDGLFERVKKCYRFVFGDQWEGLKVASDQDKPVQLNFLEPLMKQKTALVGQNTMTITYSPQKTGGDRKRMSEVCELLNRHATATWDRLALDNDNWEILQNAFIAGDQFYYFYDDGGIKKTMLDAVDVFFADEDSENIQDQPYILIRQRRYVKDVRDEAKQNGIPEEEIGKIVADEDDLRPENIDDGDFKLTSILKLSKKDGVVQVERATQAVVYQPAQPITAEYTGEDGETTTAALHLYPIAQYTWRPKRGTMRGYGDIWDKIPAQISVNKGYHRYEAAVKQAAYPKLAYNSLAIRGPDVEKLAQPGSLIQVNDNNRFGVGNLLMYLQPANISPHAASIWNDLISTIRNLGGAGDNLENVDPEQASGAAITAAREAKALNVNSQVAAYKQFIEDIARIWYDMWAAYSTNGLTVTVDDQELTIPGEELASLAIETRVDVSPNNPYSKMAQDMGLKELYQSGAISFEEYVEALDDDSSMPKAKLKEIIEKRVPQDVTQLDDAALDQQIQMLEGRVGNGMQGTPQYGTNVPVLG